MCDIILGAVHKLRNTKRGGDCLGVTPGHRGDLEEREEDQI